MKKMSFYSYLFANKKVVFGVILLILVASAFAQLTPYIQGLFVDEAILTQSEVALANLCIIFALILILDVFSKCYLSILTTKLGYSIAYKIRKDVFHRTINQPLNFFENKHNGDILQRTNYYVYNIGSYISSSISNFSIGVARFSIIFIFIFVLNWELALLLAGLYLAILAIIIVFSRIIFKLGRKMNQEALHRNSLILENLEGMETYLAYNDNFDYLKNYKKVNHEYGTVRNKYYWFYNVFNPLIDFLACLGTIIIYLVTYNQGLSVFGIGVVVAMLSYASRIISPMQMISQGLGEVFETKMIVDKVFNLGEEIKTDKNLNLDYQKIDIRCENVCFENELKESKINNLNISIPFGQKLQIIGRYGLGKTSFSYLLTGLYKCNGGKIFFNEVDITKISKQSINQMVSLVSDEVGIFRGTIMQNVRFANKQATDSAVLSAIKKAGLMPYVNSLKNKWNTKISEDKVSEGTQQLIAFARLILKNTPVIIIDEFARDLDNKKKALFLKNLAKFSQGKTLIYITQERKVDFKFDKKVNFLELVKKTTKNV